MINNNKHAGQLNRFTRLGALLVIHNTYFCRCGPFVIIIIIITNMLIPAPMIVLHI
jgi:hypothetical protein